MEDYAAAFREQLIEELKAILLTTFREDVIDEPCFIDTLSDLETPYIDALKKEIGGKSWTQVRVFWDADLRWGLWYLTERGQLRLLPWLILRQTDLPETDYEYDTIRDWISRLSLKSCNMISTPQLETIQECYDLLRERTKPFVSKISQADDAADLYSEQFGYIDCILRERWMGQR